MQQPKLFTTPTAVNQPHPTKPGLLPTWVSEQLEQNKEHAASRTAKYHHCRHCKQPILTGLDHDTCARTIHADPTPITRHEETMLTVIGRATFQATPDPPNGYQLNRRDNSEGLDWPTKNPIFPEHQCGARFNTFAPDPVGDNHHGWPDTTPPF